MKLYRVPFLFILLCLIISAASAESCSTCNNIGPGLIGNNCCSSSDTDVCGNATCKTVFLPFSQGENRARDYAGIDYFKYVNNSDENSWYFTFNIAFEENFKRGELGAYFFPNGTNTLNVGDDKFVNPLSNTDVSNFEVLLSFTFVGALTINPRIRNVIAEPTLYVGLDRWAEGLWFWTKLPITNTRWFLDCCETVSTEGGQVFNSNIFSTNSFAPAPAFGKPDQIQQAFGGVLTTGDFHCPLAAGKIICCESNLTAIADIPAHLGYNIIRKDNGYFGLYFRAVFPTGKIKNRQSLFDATVGYKRWQFGIGSNMGVKLWEKEDSSISLIADGYYTHIFKISQCRLFDLKNNGCFSRYLTMFEGFQTFTPDSNSAFLLSDVIYTGNLVPFANAFNICVQSGFDWNFDGVIFLQAQHKGWIADLGYEVKARSHENLSLKAIDSHLCNPCDEGCNDDCCAPTTMLLSKQYSIKGVLNTFQSNTSLVNQGGFAVRASVNTTRINDLTIGAEFIDNPTIFINAQNVESQLDYCSGRTPAALSHKLWGHIGYTSEHYDHPMTFGLGAEGEWGHSNKALSLWSIWGKCGIAYN